MPAPKQPALAAGFLPVSDGFGNIFLVLACFLACFRGAVLPACCIVPQHITAFCLSTIITCNLFFVGDMATQPCLPVNLVRLLYISTELGLACRAQYILTLPITHRSSHD